MDDRILQLELLVAHLARSLDDVSDVVARQEREIELLHRRIALLMAREAEREADAGTAPAANQRPPHW